MQYVVSINSGILPMVAQAGGQGSLIGATIGGYEVVALIGRGAMGAVYLARDVKLNRLVALKVLLGSLAKSPALVRQFHQEAQASAPLNHPSIVRVYSAGIEAGTPYIAMEYVEGEPLDRFLKRKGKIKWGVALHIGYKLAQGLEHAHKAGIVHRDIKPSNIMLDQHGGMRLADFGIAKIQSDDGAHDGGSFLGTPQYMSPEQATNGDIGSSSDLYSLGVTLHQMISGELPFTGESSMALINSICNDDPPRLNKNNEEIPDDVARFVAYLMGKTPQNRPANAKVVYSMIQRLLKRKGESSSLSEGLSGFIQGEMEIRAFQSLAESAGEKKNKKSKLTGKKGVSPPLNLKRLVPSALRVSIVSIVAVASFWLPTLTQRQASIDRELSISFQETLNYIEFSKSVDVYQLPSDAFKFSKVGWIGNESIVWLEVTGHEGTTTHRDIGVLGIDADTHSSMTLAQPKGPVSSPLVDPVYAASMNVAEVIALEPSHALFNRFLVGGLDEPTGDILILSRYWNRVYADPTVILRSPRENWVWGDKNDLLNPRVAEAIVNPNGSTICYLRANSEMGFTYLVEQSLDDADWLELSQPRTTPGNDIVARSVQYSPDGTHLFYLRRRSIGGAELWRVSSNGKEEDGQLIVSGVQGTEYSINPNGDTILLNLIASGGQPEELALVQVHTKRVDRLGVGRISRDSWHPSAPYFVVNQVPRNEAERDAVDEVEPLQLVAIRTDDIERRVVIAELQNGIKGSYAVSPGGQYVSAIAQDSSTPSLLIVSWSMLEDL